MKDLVNLQNAFMALDKDETGRILYDVKKITDIKNYNKYSIFSKKIWSWNKGRESESINRL